LETNLQDRGILDSSDSQEPHRILGEAASAVRESRRILGEITNPHLLREDLTIVIPTLNEEAAIGIVIDQILSQGYHKILVVDGYSKDDTVKIARSRGVSVIFQHGKGKAGAMLTGFREVETPYLILIDGDGSYDPADIDKFLPLMGEYSFVKGERKKNENMSGLHKLGNSVITRTFNMLFGTSIPDICSGMYLLRTDLVKHLHFEKHHLTVEQELAAQVLLVSKAVTSVPVNYRKRFGGESKTNTWRQGFRDLITNFDLARTYNPILLFSFFASLFIIPGIILVGYGGYLYMIQNQYHSGYFLGSLMFFVLGGQGLTVATIAAMFRRIERKV
jgi:dolichol-phosphate hexosyltransferase